MNVLICFQPIALWAMGGLIMFEKRAMRIRILKIDRYLPFYRPNSKHCLQEIQKLEELCADECFFLAIPQAGVPVNCKDVHDKIDACLGRDLFRAATQHLIAYFFIAAGTVPLFMMCCCTQKPEVCFPSSCPARLWGTRHRGSCASAVYSNPSTLEHAFPALYSACTLFRP
jgi:hypothetical protein